MNTNRKIQIDPLEAEIDNIRVHLYEQTKDMTPQERVDHVNRRAREIAKKEGLNIKFAEAPTDTPASHP